MDAILKTNWKQTDADNTRKYRDHLLSEGLEELSPQDFTAKLTELGYKLDNSLSFDYCNNLNDQSYLARAVSYTNIKTKRSAFHFEESNSSPGQLAALQKLRFSCFVWSKGRIWEL